MGRPIAMKLAFILFTLLLCVGCGATKSTQPTVLITPASATVQTGATQQFTTTSTGVTWLVNGTVGGSSSTGLISSSGLYTGPSSVPNNPVVTITAQTSSALGTATVTISINPMTNLVGTTWNITVSSNSDSRQNGTVTATLESTYLTPITGASNQTVDCGLVELPFYGQDPILPNGVWQGLLTAGVEPGNIINTWPPNAVASTCLTGWPSATTPGASSSGDVYSQGGFPNVTGFCAEPRYITIGQSSSDLTQVALQIVEAPDLVDPSVPAGSPDWTQATELRSGLGTISADGTTMTGVWSLPENQIYYSYINTGAYQATITGTPPGSPCGMPTDGTWTASKQ